MLNRLTFRFIRTFSFPYDGSLNANHIKLQHICAIQMKWAFSRIILFFSPYCSRRMNAQRQSVFYSLLAFVISTLALGISGDELHKRNDGCDVGAGTFAIFLRLSVLYSFPNRSYAHAYFVFPALVINSERFVLEICILCRFLFWFSDNRYNISYRINWLSVADLILRNYSR